MVDNLKNFYQLDTAGRVLKTCTVAFNVTDLTWDGSNLWALQDGSAGPLVALDLGANCGKIVRTLTIGYWPGSGVTWDGSAFWLGNYNDGIIHKHNAAGTQLLFFDTGFFGHPTGISFDGTDLLIGDSFEAFNRIYKYSRDGIELAYVDIDQLGLARIKTFEKKVLEWDGTYLWYSSDGRFTIYKISVGTGPLCTYSISPTTQAISSSGGTGSVTVTAPSGCAWTATTNTSWLTITSGASGSGNGTVSYSAAANTGTSIRTGIVTIAGRTFILSQAAGTAPVQVSLQPTALSFEAIIGGGTPASQSVIINSSGGSAASWTSLASTSSGGNWLSAAPASGTTPGTIFVSVDASNLGAGTYSGTIRVSTPTAIPTSQTVSVSLTVGAARPALLSLSSAAVTFSAIVGEIPAAQIVNVGNTGSGSLGWRSRFTVQTPAAGNWLLASPSSGASLASAPGPLVITANTTGLQAGVYSGTVTVDNLTNVESRTIAVTLIVSSLSKTLLLSQTGLTFTGVEGGSSIPPQTFGVLNTGSGGSQMEWSLTASTQSGGSWLTVGPTSGSSLAGSPTALPTIPLVQVGVNVSGLKAGQYYGNITVNAPGTDNSPQLVTVVLQVLPVGQNPGPIIRPTGLIFVVPAGGVPPNPQSVGLSTALGRTVQATIRPTTKDGANWLSSSSLTSAFSAATFGNFSSQVSTAGLAAANTPYLGSFSLYFDDGSPTQLVNVLFLVTPSNEAHLHSTSNPAAACVPQRLLLTPTSLSSNFASALGYPIQIQARVLDDCNNPVPGQAGQTAATVIGAPSNGDPAFVMVSIGNGLYESSYSPRIAGQNTIKIRASAASLQSVEATLPLFANSNPAVANPPGLSPGGIVNAASYAGAPLAPGSIVSAFGSNIASQAAQATGATLPTRLAGASLVIAGQAVPLFYAGTSQLNAQLPFDLPSNGQAQALLIVESGGQTFNAAPQTITVGAVQPAIFTADSSGKGQGAILNNPANQLVNATAPAKAGDVVTVYCTGLGITTPPPPASGTKTPDSPLYRVTSTVTATVGGGNAVVQFAGLAPGFVGLYQVNVEIPNGVMAGDAIPLVISQNGVASNVVTLAITGR